MTPATRWSVARMVDAIQAGEVSVRELVGAHLERAEEMQDDLNASMLLDREGALRRADRLDRDLRGGEDIGPLGGVPLGIKDLIDQAGLPTTCGSRFYRKEPDRSATVVRRLEEAGAVIVARLGLHEFAFGFSSENPWWGPVRNPWNLSASPGGSSGGSGAAVAAGLVGAALGTDTGGSVRVPAALCGVAGLKVTHGRVSLAGVFPLAPSLDTVGPLARSVEDLTLLYRTMAGHDPNDPWSAVRPVQEPGPPRALPGLRVGIPQPWVERTPLSPDVTGGFREAVERLADAGAEVIEVRHPILDHPGRLVPIIYGEAAVVHREWFPSRAGDYGPDVGERLRQAGRITLDEYVEARTWRAELRHTVDRLLEEEADVLMTPATAVTRKLIGEDEIPVGDEVHHYRRLLSAFSSLVNHMGHPALVVPVRTEGEPPPALQLVGRPWGEAGLLEIGAALEEAGIVGFAPPPRW